MPAASQQVTPTGQHRSLVPGHPLAGGSPAASVAVMAVGTSSVAGKPGSDSGLVFEYDPDYIERK